MIGNYAFEELVAELVSAFLASILGIRPKVSKSHVDYIGSWITLLEGNHSLIFKAASLAQKAVEILSKSNNPSLIWPVLMKFIWTT